MEKYLLYTHAACQPNIESGKIYALSELQKRFTLEEIKCFFTPDGFAWEEKEEVKLSKK